MVGDDGVWTAHADGTALPNPGDLAVGVVVVAPDGTRQTASRRLGLHGCNHEAEGRALHEALSLAWSLGARRVRAHSDSAVVVEQTAGGRRTSVPRLVPVFESLRALLARFDDATVVRKGRLGPGQMISANTATGEFKYDREIKEELAQQKPYRRWLDENRLELAKFVSPAAHVPEIEFTPLDLSRSKWRTGFPRKNWTWFSRR